MEPFVVERFHTTRWSLIRETSSPDAKEAASALAEFCLHYRGPLLAFARAVLVEKQDAEDYIQSFFEKLLQRQFLTKADPGRGKLRTFLLTCLKGHIADSRRHEAAAKRGGNISSLPLDDARFVTSDAAGPDKIYHRQWALLILNRTLSRLEDAWEKKGKTAFFTALKSFLDFRSDEKINRAELTKELGCTPAALKITIHRFRQEYRALLLDEVAKTLDEDGSGKVDDELRELLQAVS